MLLLLGIPYLVVVWVARKFDIRGQPLRPLATLDITFYRDDFTESGLNPKVNQTSLKTAIEIRPRHSWSIWCWLMSGSYDSRRDETKIFDFGRPASITLAFLYDFGAAWASYFSGYCLARHLTLQSPDQRVKLNWTKNTGVFLSIDTH